MKEKKKTTTFFNTPSCQSQSTFHSSTHYPDAAIPASARSRLHAPVQETDSCCPHRAQRRAACHPSRWRRIRPAETLQVRVFNNRNVTILKINAKQVKTHTQTHTHTHTHTHTRARAHKHRTNKRTCGPRHALRQHSIKRHGKLALDTAQ